MTDTNDDFSLQICYDSGQREEPSRGRKRQKTRLDGRNPGCFTTIENRLIKNSFLAITLYFYV